MAAISNRQPVTGIEYDCRGARKTKVFENAYLAKRFYQAKLNAGKNPKVVKPEPQD